MFDGQFEEAQEQSTTLELISGVVSVRGFERFLQWLYSGGITFGNESLDDQISALIEFARLADMLGIDNMEPYLARLLKVIIQTNETSSTDAPGIIFLTYKHVKEVRHLPRGHPLRLQLSI
ncbi:hypothetical protein BJX99DRAFT_32439 [Aspergillus californicus]